MPEATPFNDMTKWCNSIFISKAEMNSMNESMFCCADYVSTKLVNVQISPQFIYFMQCLEKMIQTTVQ